MKHHEIVIQRNFGVYKTKDDNQSDATRESKQSYTNHEPAECSFLSPFKCTCKFVNI